MCLDLAGLRFTDLVFPAAILITEICLVTHTNLCITVPLSKKTFAAQYQVANTQDCLNEEPDIDVYTVNILHVMFTLFKNS